MAGSDPLMFEVDLESFSGPLDLLLSLIRREQVDILDIPIARITDQYLAALQAMRERQVELSGEFMVLAATLMQIKSKLLLPRPTPPMGEEDEAEDPRQELVDLLLEYQRYREAAEVLETLALARQQRFAVRGEVVETGPPEVTDATLAALLKAYERVLHEAVEPAPPPLRAVTYTVQEQADLIVARLALGPLSFSALFIGRPSRLEVVVTFMALLELIRAGRVKAVQNGWMDEILLEQGDDGQPAAA